MGSHATNMGHTEENNVYTPLTGAHLAAKEKAFRISYSPDTLLHMSTLSELYKKGLLHM